MNVWREGWMDGQLWEKVYINQKNVKDKVTIMRIDVAVVRYEQNCISFKY